jgi:hypothetical protein
MQHFSTDSGRSTCGLHHSEGKFFLIDDAVQKKMNIKKFIKRQLRT